MYDKTKRQLEECYKHMKPYLSDKEENAELYEMCKKCPNYNGENHDFENCREKWCFKFYLGWQYLEWVNSFGCFC